MASRGDWTGPPRPDPCYNGGMEQNDQKPDADIPSEVIAAMARKPFTYLGRKGTHYLIRYPITVYWPVSLIDEWGPHPVDGAAVANRDEGVSAPVLVSPAFVGDSIARESEKQGSVTSATEQILSDRTVAR